MKPFINQEKLWLIVSSNITYGVGRVERSMPLYQILFDSLFSHISMDTRLFQKFHRQYSLI